jgi:phosphoglycerol geranylgeranyltransferase
MTTTIYDNLADKKKKGLKSFAVLIDPDHTFNSGKLGQIITIAESCQADFFFVGGSYFLENNIQECIRNIKNTCKIPVILFPGNVSHINYDADAVLFLSLISGRNPDYLIGQHVIAAPGLKKMRMEVIPTGYILIEGGRTSTVSYISFSNPIPQDQPGLAAATALAGEMLGLKLAYLEAGSGAPDPVSGKVISLVAATISLPLIVGGGINTPEKAEYAFNSGADMIVVGNKIESFPEFIKEIAAIREKYNGFKG